MTGRAGSLSTSTANLLHNTYHGWQPSLPATSSLRSVQVSWQVVPPFIELLGLDRNGAVYGARFHGDRGAIELVSAQVATTQGGYLAAARAGTDTVVAVSGNRIDWLDRTADRFHVKARMNVDFPTAVACFPAPSARNSGGLFRRHDCPRGSAATCEGG